MKTYLKFGGALTGGLFLCNIVLFLLGFHSDPEKMNSAQWLGVVLVLGILATAISLGTKARRDATPPTEEFGYGQALGAGVMTTLFGAMFGIVTSYIYSAFVNPKFSEVILQAQALKLEAKGVPADKIEQIQKMTAMWTSPGFQAVSGFIFVLLIGTIVALITSAFLKRAPSNQLPPVTA